MVAVTGTTQLAMQQAMSDAGLTSAEIDYVNAHGTSTPMNDRSECAALRAVMGVDIEQVAVSSTKSATGHLLGAAGAIEAVFCVLALRNQMLPPTLNLDDPEEVAAQFDLVPPRAADRERVSVRLRRRGERRRTVHQRPLQAHVAELE